MQHLSSKFCTVASCAVILSALSACSTGSSVRDSDLITSDSSTAVAALDARERLLDQREANLRIMPASSTSSMASSATAGLTPPNAKPGQCFTKIFTPAKYRTVSEKQMVEEAGQRIEVIPASFKNASKRVLVSEATEKLQVVPATYKTVTERVMVRPATQKIMQVPATYETVTTRVLETPARKEWKKGTGPIQRVDNDTGDIMCLVEIPATYKNISKRVLKTPATTRSVAIPAEYKTVTKQVVATAASTRTVTIPAKYKTIQVTEEATPPSQRRVEIPARYKDITRQELVSESKVEWREILCETNMTSGKITEIQRALQSAGFNPGPVDGNIGADTMSAVNAFQRAKGLPVDRYLTIDTIRALGVR